MNSVGGFRSGLGGTTMIVIQPPFDRIFTSGVVKLRVRNQLNGRMIRLSEASRRIFDAANSPIEIPEGSREDIARFVKAGMLRFLHDENAREHD
jgi:hypothetical protein